MSLIELKNVVKHYKQGTKTINAVDGINLNVKEGDFVVIIGPSGSGKSTLLQLLGGLDRPTSGSIIIDGRETTNIAEAKLTSLRRRAIGFVFQNFNLIPTLTAVQNVVAGKADDGAAPEKARKLLEQLGLGHRIHHLPSLLSGGEQQRVAIARALIHDPKILLADEPTGNLDSRTGQEIMEIMRDLNRKKGQTVIVVTHSDYVKKYATKIVQMHDGKITTGVNASRLLEKAI